MGWGGSGHCRANELWNLLLKLSEVSCATWLFAQVVKAFFT